MATIVNIMFPVGRWVSGSIYDLNTKDDKGQPLPENRHHWSYGVAIPKTAGRDWKQEPWGAQIVAAAAADWPNGESNHPSFSFKVKDGDSAISSRPNTKAPNQHEGWPGCWVVFFRRGKQIGEAPLVTANGAPDISLRAQKKIKKGDYIQVYGSVKGSNERPQNAGCFLNDEVIAFAGKGQEIVSKDRPDPTKLGFGGAVPAGATAATAAVPASAANTTPIVPAAAPAPTAVQPHTAFLTPGAAPAAPPAAPAAPVRQMTAKANGVPYEAFIAQGSWTDDLLRQHGYML